MGRRRVVGTVIVLVVAVGLFVVFAPVLFWFNNFSTIETNDRGQPVVAFSAYRSLGCAAFGFGDSLFVGRAYPQGGYLRFTCGFPELAM